MTTYVLIFRGCGHALPVSGVPEASTAGIVGNFRWCHQCNDHRMVGRIEHLDSGRSERAPAPRFDDYFRRSSDD